MARGVVRGRLLEIAPVPLRGAPELTDRELAQELERQPGDDRQRHVAERTRLACERRRGRRRGTASGATAATDESAERERDADRRQRVLPDLRGQIDPIA